MAESGESGAGGSGCYGIMGYVTTHFPVSTGYRSFVQQAHGEVDMAASTEPTVSMIHPQAWENERTVVEITPPIPVAEWAQKTDWEQERLEMLPYDSLIEEGQYAGGHVLMLHAEGTTRARAVRPK